MDWQPFGKDGYNSTLWCKVVLIVTRISTGESIEKLVDCCYSPELNGPDLYHWSEGNFSCDCNRRDGFDDDSDECTDNEYSVQLQHPLTKEVYYSD